MAAADDEIDAIERVALSAWPAAEVRALGGWRLRFMLGVTNRGNSVWMSREPEGLELDPRIREVERWYQARGVPPMFQVTPLSPPALEDTLAARGYRRHSPTTVMVADADRVGRLPTNQGVSAACEPALDEAWFELSGRGGRFQGEASGVYAGLLGRLGDHAGFARARLAGGPIGAVGLGFAAPPWVGVSSMLTVPALRRRGLAAAVLAALARFALERGAPRLYLQVESDNAGAIALYEFAGFTPLYAYRYRRRDAAEAQGR